MGRLLLYSAARISRAVSKGRRDSRRPLPPACRSRPFSEAACGTTASSVSMVTAGASAFRPSRPQARRFLPQPVRQLCSYSTAGTRPQESLGMQYSYVQGEKGDSEHVQSAFPRYCSHAVTSVEKHGCGFKMIQCQNSAFGTPFSYACLLGRKFLCVHWSLFPNK